MGKKTIFRKMTLKNDMFTGVRFSLNIQSCCLIGSLFMALFFCSCAHVITEKGKASYYADKFKGRRTANGDIFRQHKRTAASRTIPFGTKVRVTNLRNGKSVKVRINDRGPFVGGRIIDLTKKAARKIDMIRDGVAPVRLRYKIKKKH